MGCLFSISFLPQTLQINSIRSSEIRTTISKLIVMGKVLRATREKNNRKIEEMPLNFNKNIARYLSFATKTFRIVLVTSQCLQTKTFISEVQLYLLFNPFETGMSSLGDLL